MVGLGHFVCFSNLLAFSYVIPVLVRKVLVYLWWHWMVHLEREIPLDVPDAEEVLGACVPLGKAEHCIGN